MLKNPVPYHKLKPVTDGRTCSLLDKGVVLVAATAGGDGDVVEASGHQRVKNTLRTGFRNSKTVNRLLLVPQGHQVTVNLAWR